MANLLALDIGEKRIGVAIADVSAPFPAPLTTLEASVDLSAQFKALLEKHAVTGVVIGYPRNQNGEPTAQTKRVEHIVKLLKIPANTPTYWQDESLTSVKAEEELNRRKKPFEKGDIDALAATYILDDFIRNQVRNESVVAAIEPVKNEVKQPVQVKKKKSKRKKRKGLVILAVLLAVLVAIAVALIFWYTRAIAPRSEQDSYVVVTISSGAGTKQIATQLEEKKVIKSAQAFIYYVRLHGITTLQAGDYRLSSKQSVSDIAAIIESGKVTTMNMLISPGQRLDQIVKALENEGYTSEDITKALQDVRDHPLLKGLPPTTKLEGYLFPDTYKIGPSTTAEELVRLMLDTFQAKITPELATNIQSQGLSLNQAIVLASIVQKEVRDPKVQPYVAQVLLKRLRQGMQLGSDVTYLYVGGVTGKQVDPTIDSPYNTRRFVGLPPTPISNFNMSALEAVASPSQTDYLYFVAGDNGKTYFSHTLEEHQLAIAKYCTKLCK